jgi:hypothetical protein
MMMNAQLKFSTEPLKGQQMTFGQPTKTKSTKNNDPLGILQQD